MSYRTTTFALIQALGAVVLSMSVAAVHAAPTVTVNTPGAVIQGTSFDVDISIADAIDIYAFQFDLAFDPSIVRVLSVTEGTLLPAAGATFVIPGAIDNTAGSVVGMADTLMSDIPGASGDGVLFTVRMLALLPGTSALSISNALYLDSGLSDVTDGIGSVDGSVVVQPREGSVPEPSTMAGVLASLLLLGLFRKRSLL